MKHLPEHIQKHIETIAEQEKAFESRKTVMARLGHTVGGFVGSSAFVLLHVIWFGSWLLVNSLGHAFDPFPFPLLAIMIEIEGIFLASFILIRQNQMNRRSDERDHLTLQVLLLAEQEITALLDIERRKSIHNGIHEIANDENVKSLSEPTSVDDLQRIMHEHLPLE